MEMYKSWKTQLEKESEVLAFEEEELGKQRGVESSHYFYTKSFRTI